MLPLIILSLVGSLLLSMVVVELIPNSPQIIEINDSITMNDTLTYELNEKYHIIGKMYCINNYPCFV